MTDPGTNIIMGLSHEKDLLIIEWGRELSWIGLSKKEAVEFAMAILRYEGDMI